MTRSRLSTSEIVVSPHAAPQPAGRESDAKSEVLKQAALSAVRQWWKVAFPLGLLLAAGAAAGVYFNFQPKYQARATVEIAEEAPFFLFSDVRQRSSERFVRTQQELLRARW